MPGENAIPAIAIIEKHSRMTRTARIPNCGKAKPKKVFLGLLGDVDIQEPFTGRLLHKKQTGIGIVHFLAEINAQDFQSGTIIPIHYAREKGQCWLSKICHDGEETREISLVVGRIGNPSYASTPDVLENSRKPREPLYNTVI